jgi:6-pyruvoyltetrahydropterin/6-carboxytetrahydropterin synthase
MKHTISKEFHFSAAHILSGLREGHPCGRLHGHNYVIIVELQGDDLDDNGFIQDYGELKPIGEFIDNNWDHQFLNDLMPVNPTAENMAEYLFNRFADQFPKMTAITVKETPKTAATFRL